MLPTYTIIFPLVVVPFKTWFPHTLPYKVDLDFPKTCTLRKCVKLLHIYTVQLNLKLFFSLIFRRFNYYKCLPSIEQTKYT